MANYVWNWADGGLTTGINYNTSLNTQNPNLCIYNNELYCVWVEQNSSGNYQIRVKKWNGSSWTFVDGNSTTGLNYDITKIAQIPNLCVYNNELYCSWYEYTSASRQIRVKKYNGSSWTFVDGNTTTGINYNTSEHGYGPNLCIYNNNLYCTWYEQNGNGIWQIRIKQWNGTSWSFVDGNGTNGLNYNTSKHAYTPNLCVYNNTLYCTWYENNSSGISQIRVKKWNGTTWTFVDGNTTTGINYNTSYSACSSILCVYNNVLYCIWQELNSSSIYQVRVKKYDGTSWTFVDGNGTNGLNYDITKTAQYPNLYVYNNELYCTWEENNSSGIPQIRVKKWNGSTWTFVDGNGTNGLNYNVSKTAQIPNLYVYNNTLYCTWVENDVSSYNQVRVKDMKTTVPPIFTGNVSLSNVHNSDVQLSGSITNDTDTIQYKISVNGSQIYPTSGYTTLSSSPVSVNYTIPNNLLTQLTNIITIDCNSSSNLTCTNSYNVSIYNNSPSGILTSSNTTIHGQDINITGTLSDTDLDQISYRILLNHVELQTWSTFTDNPNINYTILNDLLNMGDNTITIEYKDNFKNSLSNVWTQIITKTNNTSIINIEYINGSVMGNIIDPDSDLTQYQILINGIQKYPDSGFTNFELNSTINYLLNRNDILINQNNIITINAKDSFDSNVSQEISFVGDYVGLMFMDENMQFYTSDIGQLLKYLDFGTITLGIITEPVKILVKNKFGFPIKDINLIIDNGLPNITVELCKEQNPFIATDNLIIENTYNPNDMDYFYIRLNTCISQTSVDGTFTINAKATPLI